MNFLCRYHCSVLAKWRNLSMIVVVATVISSALFPLRIKSAEKQILVAGNAPEFWRYIFIALTMALCNYPKLKHWKLVAVVGLNNLMETEELSWFPVNKKPCKALLSNNYVSFFLAFSSLLWELMLLLLLYRWWSNTYIFFTIYPASAHYSIHLLKKAY